VWPLPRQPGGPSDAEIADRFARFEAWHYGFAFDGGLTFTSRVLRPRPDTYTAGRPLQRFAHMIPWLVQAVGGTLAGKRVLDIACNAGFWSLQCALLGAAEVVGFDARPELVEQAELVRSIVGAANARFQVLDFWSMCPRALGGTFDVVLSLGILYHLPKPLEALEAMRSMSHDTMLLDTAVHPGDAPVVRLEWEEPDDIRRAAAAGIVAYPSKSSVVLMLRHLGLTDVTEIPVCSADVPDDYLTGLRASWLVRVGGR
jgi:SAM-dependent methyltransferase